MSEQGQRVVERARELLEQARLLPGAECARVLEQVVTMAQAVQAEVLAAAERSGELGEAGCVSVRGFATTVLRRSGADASMLAALALHLPALPRLTAAYREGRVPTHNLRAILARRRACGLAALQDHEEALLGLATRAGPEEIREFCDELADVVAPTRSRAAVVADGERLVRLARVGDFTHLDAMLDPQVGEQLQATLAAMARNVRRPARVRLGAADTPGDDRPYPVRAAEALEQVLLRGMDTADVPTAARRRPHVRLTVDLATLLGLPDHGRALLERFGLVREPLATRLACDALVQLVLRQGDRVLNVGRSQRVVTGRQLAALAATHRTCAVPGCAIRFSDCEIHHLWWWSLGGPTDLDLQVPLCRTHHRHVHERRFTLTRESGELAFRDPRGRRWGDRRALLRREVERLRRPPTTTWELSPPLAGLPERRYHRGRWGASGRLADDPPLPDATPRLSRSP